VEQADFGKKRNCRKEKRRTAAESLPRSQTKIGIWYGQKVDPGINAYRPGEEAGEEDLGPRKGGDSRNLRLTSVRLSG